MRQALRGLTTRGRSFLAAAAAAGLSALVLGERDLLRVAILLAALPLLAAAYVGQTRYRLSCTRDGRARPGPGRLAGPGAAAAVQPVPPAHRHAAAGGPAAVRAGQPAPAGAGAARRPAGEHRGVHRAGRGARTLRGRAAGGPADRPVRAVRADPVLRHASAGSPWCRRPCRCPSVRLAGEYAGSGDSRARSVAVHGEDDIATREYRHGDDLRRVHWRSTARVGELMVRREEQPWESRATVVLDTRAAGPPRRGPDVQLRVGGVGGRQHRAAPAPQRLPDPAGHRRRGGPAPGRPDTTEHDGEGALLDAWPR